MRSWTLAGLLAALFAMTGTVAARGGMPTPLTDRGRTIESIYYQIFVAGMIVFVIVMVWLVVAMWRYRAHGGKGRATFEHERENLKVELAWIGIPLIVVLWVGYISYVGLVELDEGFDDDEYAMEVDIVGQKWFWQANYDDFTVNANWVGEGEIPEGLEFVVPADVPIRFNITGVDVIHAFHIMDANRATFGLVDANPFGPHKYTEISGVMTEGTYSVQCREMCFNPGHGYMRATIIALPMADYEAWYAEMEAGAAAGLEQSIAIELDGGISADASKTAVGATVTLQFANAGADVTFTSPNGTTFTVPGGGAYAVQYVADELGDHVFTSSAGNFVLTAVEPETIEIELGDLFIKPETFTMVKGEVYFLHVINAGNIPHNFYIGTYSTDEASKNTIWASKDLNGGDDAIMLVVPTDTVTFDTWCNISGHAAGGMLAEVVVE